MWETQKNFNWTVHQNDPNNWVRIPEFGVIPVEVSFDGFAMPILGPKFSGFHWRVPVWETVKIVRSLAQKRFGTLANLHDVVLSLYESNLIDPEFDEFTSDQALAFFYDGFFFNVERAVSQSGKTLVGEQSRSASLARAMESAVGFLAGQPISQKAISLARSELARSGSEARHAENRAMKRDVFAWLDANMVKFNSMDDAATAIAGKVEPIKWRTAREWVGDWKKLRSTGTA